MTEENLVPRAVERIARLRRMSGLLEAIPSRREAFRAVDRIATALETAVEKHRTGSISAVAEDQMAELLDRLDESTWDGKTSSTKNDVLRQAYFGVVPPAADRLYRSLAEDTRQAAAERSRTFRRDEGAIDLSGAVQSPPPLPQKRPKRGSQS